ncbi:MAG TPA: tetratricopeptide repeat protein [Gemmatimonadaceae bacterium]|jgi:tetratricopeptide (TPR) repeat protein
MQRHAAAAAGILVLSLASTPIFAQQQPAQRGGPPGSDTPYILIATFHSSDMKLGVDAADEVRHRVQDEHTAKELYVVPKMNINNTLEASGYRPDSALNASDLMELSKQLHGEFVLDGTATKLPNNGVRIESRLLTRTGTQTLVQPLPPVDGKDVGEAGKSIERSISEALKGMPAYKTCTNDLRAAKYADAVTQAQIGIKAYPGSVLNRLCELSAYSYNKAPADAVIALSNEILALDPTSMIALTNLADSYAQKGDTSKAIETNLRIYRADPTNQAVAESIVAQLANSGAPDKALPIIDSLLKDNPGDAGMVHTKWSVLRRAKQWKDAIATGELLAKLDTTQITVDYFNRMISDAQADSDVAKQNEIATKAAQKFPTDVDFPLLLASNYQKAGQLQQALTAARRATVADPKSANAWLLSIITANSLKMSDSSGAWAKSAIAAGVSKDQLGAALIGPANDAFQKAQASKLRADWFTALQIAEQVDSIAPTTNSKFFIGVTSYSAAADIMTEVQELIKSKKKEDHAQACTEVKQAEDLFATTSIAMPAGGSVSPPTAGQILGAVQQYGPYIDQFKKTYCKP